MEYGAIDLHTKESEIRIVDGGRRGRVRATHCDDAGAADRRVRCAGPAADSAGEWHGQRMGRAASRGLGARGGRGRSELRADVRAADAPDQDRSARRRGAGGGESARASIARAHRVSAPQRDVRRRLRVRDQLVHVRRQAINLLRAQLRSEGVRVPTGAAETFAARFTASAVSAAVRERDGAAAGVAGGRRAADRPGRAVDARTRRRRMPSPGG